MRVLRVLLLLSLFALPAALAAHSQVAVGIGIGPVVAPIGYDGDYGYGPPVCSYGYYPYYPYSCAPYGYYGPSWFAGGIFIGAGPWYHGYYGRGPWYGYGHGRAYFGGVGYRGFNNAYRGRYAYGGARPAYASGFHGGYAGTARPSYGGSSRFHGAPAGGNAFHGNAGGGFHSGGFSGGGGFHGGGGHR